MKDLSAGNGHKQSVFPRFSAIVANAFYRDLGDPYNFLNANAVKQVF